MSFLSVARASFAVAVAALATLAAPASAQTTPSAQALYDEGVKAYAQGDLATACPKFKQSFETDKQPAPLFMLAKCEEKQGKIGSALVHFEEVLRVGGLEAELRDQAARSVNDLAVRAPRLTLRRGAAPAAAVAKIDGVLFTIDGRPEPIDPGEHELLVTAPAHGDNTKTFVVKEGEKLSLDIEVGPALPIAGPTIPDTAPPPPGPDPTPFWIGGGIAAGVGVVGFVIAGVTGGLILSGECDGDLACPNRSEDFDSGGLVIANYVGWAVGGAGVATGAILFIVGAVKSNEAGDARLESGAVRPVPGPGDAGLGLQLTL